MIESIDWILLLWINWCVVRKTSSSSCCLRGRRWKWRMKSDSFLFPQGQLTDQLANHQLIVSSNLSSDQVDPTYFLSYLRKATFCVLPLLLFWQVPSLPGGVNLSASQPLVRRWKQHDTTHPPSPTHNRVVAVVCWKEHRHFSHLHFRKSSFSEFYFSYFSKISSNKPLFFFFLKCVFRNPSFFFPCSRCNLLLKRDSKTFLSGRSHPGAAAASEETH